MENNSVKSDNSEDLNKINNSTDILQEINSLQKIIGEYKEEIIKLKKDLFNEKQKANYNEELENNYKSLKSEYDYVFLIFIQLKETIYQIKSQTNSFSSSSIEINDLNCRYYLLEREYNNQFYQHQKNEKLLNEKLLNKKMKIQELKKLIQNNNDNGIMKDYYEQSILLYLEIKEAQKLLSDSKCYIDDLLTKLKESEIDKKQLLKEISIITKDNTNLKGKIDDLTFV